MWRAHAFFVAMLVACCPAPLAQADSDMVTELRPTVLNRIDHDPTAFTEGLFLDGTSLYESTGLVGHSELRELDPVTGQVRRASALPPTYFGEGIADAGNRIWQLTYQNGVAIEWDKSTLEPVREVPLQGDGWGLCRDGDRLIRSDGSAKLHFHSVEDMHEIGSITATYNGIEATGLNSLNCSGNHIWVNVFPTNAIAQIDATTGKVETVARADGLLDTPHAADVDVLNGIARLGNGDFLLTGKNWPTMYRVQFLPA